MNKENENTVTETMIEIEDLEAEEGEVIGGTAGGGNTSASGQPALRSGSTTMCGW